MTTEENKRMLALSCIVSDLKTENMELVERVQQLSADYADVCCKLNEKEKRKNEDASINTLVELRQMEEQYDKLEREYKELRFLAKGIYSFVKEKNLYIKKDDECPYVHRGITACSSYCMGCPSCLGDIYGVGVICEKRLKEANVSLPNDVCEKRSEEASEVFPNDE